MTKTESFIAAVKRLVHRKGPTSEWQVFTGVAKELRAGTIRDITETFYNATVNRISKQPIIHAYWNLVTAYYLAKQFSLEKIGNEFRSNLEMVIKHNHEQPLLTQPMKELVKREAQVAIILDTTISSSLFYMAFLTAGYHDRDVKEDCEKLQDILSSLSLTRRILQTLAYMKEKKFTKCHYIGIVQVHNLASPYALIGTGRPLEPLPEDPAHDTAFMKKLASIALRFPVEEKVTAQHASLLSACTECIEDIVDYYRDLPTGGVRPVLLKRLKQLLSDYTELRK